MVSSELLMHHVKVKVEAGMTPESTSLFGAPATLDFIFGASSGGLLPFETRLTGLNVGESTTVEVSAEQLGAFFGVHYHQLSWAAMVLPAGMVSVHLTLVDSRPADPREVVKAISSSLSGCGGGCGCGCG